MRLVAVATMIWATWALPGWAQEDDIAAVIADQFEDFRADDMAGAFEHASPTIRGLFGTPDNFGTMVRNGYPMVYRPRTFRFLDLNETPDGLRQIVEVEDMQGQSFLLGYDMIETGDGWKIDGVQVIPAPGVAA